MHASPTVLLALALAMAVAVAAPAAAASKQDTVDRRSFTVKGEKYHVTNQALEELIRKSSKVSAETPQSPVASPRAASSVSRIPSAHTARSNAPSEKTTPSNAKGFTILNGHNPQTASTGRSNVIAQGTAHVNREGYPISTNPTMTAKRFSKEEVLTVLGNTGDVLYEPSGGMKATGEKDAGRNVLGLAGASPIGSNSVNTGGRVAVKTTLSNAETPFTFNGHSTVTVQTEIPATRVHVRQSTNSNNAVPLTANCPIPSARTQTNSNNAVPLTGNYPIPSTARTTSTSATFTFGSAGIKTNSNNAVPLTANSPAPSTAKTTSTSPTTPTFGSHGAVQQSYVATPNRIPKAFIEQFETSVKQPSNFRTRNSSSHTSGETNEGSSGHNSNVKPHTSAEGAKAFVVNLQVLHPQPKPFVANTLPSHATRGSSNNPAGHGSDVQYVLQPQFETSVTNVSPSHVLQEYYENSAGSWDSDADLVTPRPQYNESPRVQLSGPQQSNGQQVKVAKESREPQSHWTDSTRQVAFGLSAKDFKNGYKFLFGDKQAEVETKDQPKSRSKDGGKDKQGKQVQPKVRE